MDLCVRDPRKKTICDTFFIFMLTHYYLTESKGQSNSPGKENNSTPSIRSTEYISAAGKGMIAVDGLM